MKQLKTVQIGIFDTGKGGEIVAELLKPYFPDAKFITADDTEHAPYGQLPTEEIIEFSTNAIAPLITAGCNPIIIACNTATTIAITALRESYPAIQFIGMEPMIKPAAAATKTGAITVLATPATLQSVRYVSLKHVFAKELIIYEPDCADWAQLIQSDSFPIERLAITADEIATHGSDQVVIGCTHYLAIADALRAQLPNTIAIQNPIPPIAKRISELLG